jgi:hypothetical protein
MLVILFACKTKQTSPASKGLEFTPDFTRGPSTMVYKADNKYRELVPVLLSNDMSRIVAYPGIHDIETPSGFPVPATLHKGYYLDNRGITSTVAFLKLTYEEYSKLDSLPSTEVMYTWIVDKDPLKALCDCGSRKMFTNVEEQLNAVIDAGKLEKICRVVR